jgi:hypothetical protein
MPKVKRGVRTKQVEPANKLLDAENKAEREEAEELERRKRGEASFKRAVTRGNAATEERK